MLSSVLDSSDTKSTEVSGPLWELVYNHLSHLLKWAGCFCLGFIKHMKSLTSLERFPLRAGALCSPLPPSSARARTPGGHSRPGWNKTNCVVGRSSNKSVLERESGCRRGKGWDRWGQVQGAPRCHQPWGQSPDPAVEGSGLLQLPNSASLHKDKPLTRRKQCSF